MQGLSIKHLCCQSPEKQRHLMQPQANVLPTSSSKKYQCPVSAEVQAPGAAALSLAGAGLAAALAGLAGAALGRTAASALRARFCAGGAPSSGAASAACFSTSCKRRQQSEPRAQQAEQQQLQRVAQLMAFASSCVDTSQRSGSCAKQGPVRAITFLWIASKGDPAPCL